MKFFKHFSDNHRGQSVQYLLDELGYFGPFFYYTLYEMCAEKLDKRPDRKVDETDCHFVFHMRVVCSAMRAKPSRVGSALVAGSSCGLWTFSLDQKQIRISMPILLELLEREMKYPRNTREKSAPYPRLDIDIDKELDKEYKERIPEPVGSDISSLTKKEKEEYAETIYDAYPRKEGKSKGLKILFREIKTPDDFAALHLAVTNYAEKKRGSDPKFLLLFSTFMAQWRDWLDSTTGTVDKNFTKKQSAMGDFL